MKRYDDAGGVGPLRVRAQAKPETLIHELRDAVNAAAGLGVFDRLLLCYQTKQCLWDNQQSDGRYGKRVAGQQLFRWEGAPDLRVPMADTIVRKLSLIRNSVLARGEVNVAPRLVAGGSGGSGSEAGPDAVMESGRSDLAAVWQSTLEHFRHLEARAMTWTWKLFNVCVEEFGYAGILPSWEKVRRMELRKMSLQEMADAAVTAEREAVLAMAGPDVPEEMVLTPLVLEEIASRVNVRIEEALLEAEITADAVELARAVDPNAPEAELRYVLRQLRKNAAEPAEYQTPLDEGGRLRSKVLVPWVNFIHAHDMDGCGGTDWFAMPEYLSEVELSERSTREGWNKKAVAWLRETQRNKMFCNLYSDLMLPGWAMNGVGVGLTASVEALERMPRWLVMTEYRRVVDEAGVPRICKVVFHPAMSNDVPLLLWEETDLNTLPLLVDTCEPVTFAMMARGVPEIVIDKQNFIKDGMDAEGARGHLGSNPPLLRSAKEHVGVRPGLELFSRRTGQSFEGSQFMDVPIVDQGTLGLMDRAQAMVNQYYFCDKATDPEDKRMFYEAKENDALRVLTEWMRHLWRLIQENVDEVQAGRIAGKPVMLAVNRDQLQGETDVMISFHSGAYAEGAAEKFFDVLGKAMQMDRGGALDWTEAMNVGMQLLAPSYARRLVRGADEAVAANRAAQRERLAQIMSGVQVEYQDMVPGVNDRMQEMQGFLANPYNQQRVQASPDIQAAIEKEWEYLSFHLQQQTVNPVIGRTGVKPGASFEGVGQ